MPPVDEDVSCLTSVSELLAKAKQAIDDEDVRLSLRCYLRAYQLEPSDKLLRRANRMKVKVIERIV